MEQLLVVRCAVASLAADGFLRRHVLLPLYTSLSPHAAVSS
jgi:hypothetical protein